LIKYNFIPSQTHLYSFALPVFLKLSDIQDSQSSLIITSLSVDSFYSLLNRETGVWGTNIDVIDGDQIFFRDIKTMGCNVLIKNKDCFFIGPSVVFYDDGMHNMVFGIDDVVLHEMPSTLEPPNVPKLRIVDQFEKIERDPKYRIMNEVLFDYAPAIEKGNELIKRYGIRTGSKINFYGDYKEVKDKDFECAIIVVSPNNRHLNPCVIKTIFEKNDKIEEKILEFMSEISLLGKQYHNYYMFRSKVENGRYLMGVFDLASVLVEYHVDTSVHLLGTRDHHENAGVQ